MWFGNYPFGKFPVPFSRCGDANIGEQDTTAENDLDRQQTLDTCVLGNVNNNAAAQVALGFRRFLAHQVAHARSVALNLARTSNGKTLLGAGVGFHLRHK